MTGVRATCLQAVCFPNLNTLLRVDRDSRMLLNDYRYLRARLLESGGEDSRLGALTCPAARADYLAAQRDKCLKAFQQAVVRY